MDTSTNTKVQRNKKIATYNNLLPKGKEEEIGSQYCSRCMSSWLDQPSKIECPVCGRRLYDFRNETCETLLQIIDAADMDSDFPTISCPHCGIRNFADGSFINCRICKAPLPLDFIKRKSIWSRIKDWFWELLA
jgi:DNA-directed RNA polymerase subunit RPC12/RpoP